MNNRPSASDIPDLWEVDGSLRDMYVFNMSMGDWVTFLAFSSSFESVYSFDGERRNLPHASHLFSERGGSHLLAIQVGSASVNCHFFVESELELDVDPKEVTGPPQHNLLLEFAEAVALSLRKPIILTPENAPESPFLTFDSITSQWHVHS